GDGRPRNVQQQGLRRAHQSHRLLVTVAVKEDRRWSLLQRQARRELAHELLEEDGGPGNGFCLRPRLAAEQRRRILSNRRQTTRLAEHNSSTSERMRIERIGVLLRGCSRRGQQALRNL